MTVSRVRVVPPRSRVKEPLPRELEFREAGSQSPGPEVRTTPRPTARSLRSVSPGHGVCRSGDRRERSPRPPRDDPVPSGSRPAARPKRAPRPLHAGSRGREAARQWRARQDVAHPRREQCPGLVPVPATGQQPVRGPAARGQGAPLREAGVLVAHRARTRRRREAPCRGPAPRMPLLGPWPTVLPSRPRKPAPLDRLPDGPPRLPGRFFRRSVDQVSRRARRAQGQRVDPPAEKPGLDVGQAASSPPLNAVYGTVDLSCHRGLRPETVCSAACPVRHGD